MEFKKEIITFTENIPFDMYETTARQVMIHSHDCLEINLICAGSGYYRIEDHSYPIRQGDLFIINNAEHHMAVHDGSLRMLVFVFSPEFVWGTPQEYAYLNPFFERGSRFSNRIGNEEIGYKEMADCLHKIAGEYEEKKESWELMVKARLLMFLAFANRHYEEQETEDEPVDVQKYSRIRDAVAYIHAHFTEELSLEELAEQAAMGKSYFSTYFSEVMRQNVVDYTNQVRVGHAAMLLKTTQESMLEIALQSGFHSSAYFNRVFKKIMNMTPTAYRKSKNRTNFKK